jgi:hypothetical protein
LPDVLHLRRALRLLVIFGLLLVSTPAAADADWQFAPLFGLTFKGQTTLVDLEKGAGKVHWNVGGAATLIGRGPVGIEGLFVFIPHFFETDEVSALAGSRTMAVMGNVVLATPRSWNEYGLRPYVSGGLGLMHASQRTLVPDIFPVNKSLLGYNVGGGAVGFVTDRTGLRFDLRYFSSLSRTDQNGIAFGPVRLRYWSASTGIVFRY